MTIWYLLSFALRALGLFQWADAAFDKHQAKVKAQEQANAALNDQEESSYWRR
jgi:hypothetical protein